MSQFFISSGQNSGASVSASVLSMNIQYWFPSGSTGLISGLSRIYPPPQFKTSILWRPAFFWSNFHIHTWLLEKTIALTRWTLVSKVMSLLFNMLFRLVIAFLPRSKHLLISWLHTPSAVIVEPKKIVCHCFHRFPTYLPWSDGTASHDLCFFNVKPVFFTLLFKLTLSSRGSLVHFCFLP